jgi:hypothetical protein
MIHEFEEIIFVRKWLTINENNAKLVKDMWLKNRNAYPSTSAIALMIGEEFILIVILSLLAIWLHFAELAVGMFVGHTLHLVGHIGNAIRVKMWSHGSITAAVTLPVNAAIITYFLSQNQFSATCLAIGLLIAGTILLGNLALIHKLAPKFNDFILNFYKKS